MIERVIPKFLSDSLKRSNLRLLFLLLAVFTFSWIASRNGLSQSAAAAGHQEIIVLEPRIGMDRELAGGQKHTYQISLGKGQYASVIVAQRGIDVAVRLLGMQGEIIETIDNEYRNQGEEKVEMVAEAVERYRLSVTTSSISAPAGQYEIRIQEIRAATKNDRLMYEARTLKADSSQSLLEGKYEDARQSAERALGITEGVLGNEAPLMAGLLYNLASYYEKKQDFVKAQSLLERALAIITKAFTEDDPRTIEIRRMLAFLCYETNDMAKAKQLVQHALEVSQKTLGPEHYLSAKCLFTLAQVTSDSNKAEQLLQRSLMVAENTLGTDDIFVGDVLNTLGVLYTDNREYQQAEQFLMRSQSIYEKAEGPDNISHVVILHNLGRIAQERKDFEKAEEYYKEAIAIVEKIFGPENPRLPLTLNNLANIYRAKGEYSKSLEAHLRVLRISETTRGPYHPLTLTSLGNIAKTYAAQNNIAEAMKFQSRVDAVIERNIEMNLAIGSEREKVSYMKSMAERTDRTISFNSDLAPNEPAASALATLVLLQRKGRLLDAMSESFVALRQRSTTEERALLQQFNDLAAQLGRLVLNGPQGIAFEQHQGMISELEEQKERLEVEISRRSSEFRAQSQPVSLAAVQSTIPPNAALVEFAVFRPFDPKAKTNSEAYEESHYIAYVLHQKGEITWRDLGTAKPIDDEIEQLREALRDPKRQDVQQLARVVDQRIMQPIRPLLGDAKHILISPDGTLNLLPFEALVDEQNRYLIERFSCTYLTSGRDLLRLQVARDSKTNPVVFADPMFGEPESIAMVESINTPKPQDAAYERKRQAAAKSQSITAGSDLSEVYFAPLAGTAQEAQAIKSLFAEASVLTGRQASESSIKGISAPRIVHIATHGFFLTEAPASSSNASEKDTRSISANVKIENPLLRSGLALAGANLHQSNDEDGILTALEASGLNLWGTKLVTLSACDTGLGEVKNGEGVYGLRRAFLLAGTQTLVMSLWPVSDYVTRELMTSYYKGLKQGLGRGEALRHVQLSMLKRKGREHPFYWASFIQSGEWANLNGKR